jgi:hypothetical protein
MTCPIGNFRGINPADTSPINQGHAQEHHWKYLSRVSGTATLLVSSREPTPASITLTASHDAGTSSVTASGLDDTKALAVPVTANTVYDIVVTATPALSGAQSVHYRIGAMGPGAKQVEIGYGDPKLEYLEPLATIQRWAVNGAAGETLSAVVSVDDTSGVPNPPGVPGQATSVTFNVLDSGGSLVLGPTTSAISFGGPVTFSFTNASLVTQPYMLILKTNGHFKLTKTSGTDHGLYALNCPDFSITKRRELGPNLIGIYQSTPTEYIFEIQYQGPPALVIDTVPAEFEVVEAVINAGGGTVTLDQNRPGTATHILWTVASPNPFGRLAVRIRTVQSPGTGHREPVYKPTSCGPLSLNDGATAYRDVSVFNAATGATTTQRLAIGPSNSLVVTAVAGAKPCEGG